jgi:hypothetical protein
MLLLDELSESKHHVLEVLRQPIEKRIIRGSLCGILDSDDEPSAKTRPVDLAP